MPLRLATLCISIVILQPYVLIGDPLPPDEVVLEEVVLELVVEVPDDVLVVVDPLEVPLVDDATTSNPEAARLSPQVKVALLLALTGSMATGVPLLLE